VLDEDLAFEVGDGDLVAGDDDEDLLEARRPSTMYWTLFRMKTPLLVSFLTTVPSGRSVGSGAGVGRGRLAGRRIRSRGGEVPRASRWPARRSGSAPARVRPARRFFAIGGQNADSDDPELFG
jgi:hypothetical protein